MAATTAKQRKHVDHLHQLIAYARNANLPSIEKLLLEIAEDLEVKVDEKDIERRRQP